MKLINEGIGFLADKYGIEKKIRLIDRDTVVIDGERHTLLPWRSERRIIELKNIAMTMQGISMIRVSRIDKKRADIMKMFCREADICEFVLGSAIKEIFAVENSGKAMNAVLKTESGVVCTLELAATLSDEKNVIDKHEIISQNGVACDRGVDTQIPQQSVYVLKAGENKEYTDTDAELYGLSSEDASIARQCFETARGNVCFCNQAGHLQDLAAACRKSIETEENTALCGGEINEAD